MLLRPALPHYFFLVYLLFQNVAVAEDYSSLSSVPTTTVRQEITTILNSKQNPLLARANFEYRAEDVDALYKTTNYTPLWLNNPQNLTDVLALLSSAAAQGLNAADYSAAVLQQKLPFIQLLKSEASTDLALYDTALTV